MPSETAAIVPLTPPPAVAVWPLDEEEFDELEEDVLLELEHPANRRALAASAAVTAPTRIAGVVVILNMRILLVIRF